MARGRDRSRSTVGDQAVVLENETNLGGTGNVEFFSSHELNHLNLKILCCRCGGEPYRCERKLWTLGSRSKGVDSGKDRLLHQNAISAWPTPLHAWHRCCSNFYDSSCFNLFAFVCFFMDPPSLVILDLSYRIFVIYVY